MQYIYQTWIILTAFTALAAFLAGVKFCYLRGKLASVIAFFCFTLTAETLHSAITLSYSVGSVCQVTDYEIIFSRWAIRVLQAASAILLFLYSHGWFQDDVLSKLANCRSNRRR